MDVTATYWVNFLLAAENCSGFLHNRENEQRVYFQEILVLRRNRSFGNKNVFRHILISSKINFEEQLKLVNGAPCS